MGVSLVVGNDMCGRVISNYICGRVISDLEYVWSFH